MTEDSVPKEKIRKFDSKRKSAQMFPHLHMHKDKTDIWKQLTYFH